MRTMPFTYLTPSFWTRKFPPVVGIRWFNLTVLTITPAIALYGIMTLPLKKETMIFSVLYYVFSMLGVTAGYHRLWSHRSYSASTLLRMFLICGGTSAVQGSCLWWAKAHRSHHRHTDTDLDPYNSSRGLLWTHVGWMLVKTKSKTGVGNGSVDVNDLRKDPLVTWQHRWYFLLAIVWGMLVPILVAGLFWGDWWGGFCFVGAARLTLAHHSTFCINSIAHYLGSTPYDDTLSPRDHLLSALLTMGEGYHNFHHQFPMDYRNAYLWYQWDPTKWFIATCNILGLVKNLKVFSGNEIRKGMLTMELKRLKKVQDGLQWPLKSDELPIWTWVKFQEEADARTLITISGFIHDTSSFVANHPGGKHLLESYTGKDATNAFFGGVYRHSSAAQNLLAMMRIGVIKDNKETQEVFSPSERLYITHRRAKC
ncbi:Acyl-CoA desaturase [Leucoagaricus sp. SymC.cos]|nr:Acyl-CoA desaturase [Leucoagaricus sp. SymC.cos]